jgi:hypothetical protein
MTRDQVTAACKGAFAGGAKQATVEVRLLPDGTKVVKVTASAQDAANGGIPNHAEVNEWDEVIRDGAH